MLVESGQVAPWVANFAWRMQGNAFPLLIPYRIGRSEAASILVALN
jgi:hypothetical protein